MSNQEKELYEFGCFRLDSGKRLLLRDNDPARPVPDEIFSDRRTVEIGGERIELAWHGATHTPDNILRLPGSP